MSVKNQVTYLFRHTRIIRELKRLESSSDGAPVVGLRSVPLKQMTLSLGTMLTRHESVRKEFSHKAISHLDHIVAELADAHGLRIMFSEIEQSIRLAMGTPLY